MKREEWDSLRKVLLSEAMEADAQKKLGSRESRGNLFPVIRDDPRGSISFTTINAQFLIKGIILITSVPKS